MNDYLRIVINAFLAGTLVTLGALTDGQMNFETIYFACIAGAIIAINQIKEKLNSKKNKRGNIKILTLI